PGQKKGDGDGDNRNRNGGGNRGGDTGILPPPPGEPGATLPAFPDTLDPANGTGTGGGTG
ncbi:MAG TPA: hypothetical protein VFR35_04085, partial [Actinoplanes sp.]|nr:hypothetical protein [Actinoplanes sp.]